jgi:hypothetical protein
MPWGVELSGATPGFDFSAVAAALASSSTPRVAVGTFNARRWVIIVELLKRGLFRQRAT